MKAGPALDRERHARLRRIVLWMGAITVTHFALGTRTHLLHGWHVLLASAYMVPIVDAALGFGLPGGLVAAVAAMACYAAHLGLSWSGEPLANLDQTAMLGVYLFVGVSSGLLAREAERRRRERDEVIRRSLRSEMLQGILGLVAALGARSPEARRHAERVSRWSDSIAREMGLDRDRRGEVALAGLVHDLGRLVARDGPEGEAAGTANAPDDEQAARRRAVEVLRSIPGADTIVAIVGSMHERTGGSTVRAGLTTGPIHPGARIVHVADVYVGLVEGREARGAVTPAQALDLMRPLAETCLDKDSFLALRSLVGRGQAPPEPDDH